MQRNIAFGRWLKERRRTQDLTQEQLAQLAGCAAETVRKFESGALRPSKQIAERLAAVLDIPADQRDAFVRLARAAAPDAPAATLATPAPDAPAPANPYKGLRPFMEADAADFFGREALVRDMLAAMAEEDAAGRFLALVGPSGGGKSSIVRAGLIPALRGGALPESERWLVATMFPGAHPLEELEAALLRVAPDPPPGLIQQLREGDHGLLRAIKRILPADTTDEIVLVIDQFEELFTLTPDEPTRLRVLNSLHAAVTDPRSRLRVVITLRADCYDRPLLYADFGDLMRRRTILALPPAPEDLLRAIVYPAERAGVAFAADLVAAIMNDVGAQPGALPLLQYALTELFERREAGRISLAAYHASGGVPGALARRADEIYAGLSAQQQILARELFLRLVTPGEGREDMRRRVPRAELESAQDGASDEAALDAVIERYGRYRILTFDRDPITRAPTVELAHEALIRAWGRLQEWLDESRADVLTRRRLAVAAAEWADARRDPSFLAAGARLDQLAEWSGATGLTLNQAERAYLDASLAERRTRDLEAAAARAHEAALERRSRTVLRALVVVLLLATLGALALTKLARDSAAEARDQALIAGAQAALNEGNTGLALALAIVANQTDSPAAQMVLAQAAYAPGTRLRFVGHKAGVESVAFSPDGRWALSASDDQMLILWDVATGAPIRSFEGHKGAVQSAVFSADGSRALSVADDQTPILWDVASGQPIRRFKPYKSKLYMVALSPDGRRALAAAADMRVVVWDVAAGAPTRVLVGHTDKVKAVVFSPDGRLALSASDDKTLILWDVASGRMIRRFVGHTDGVNAVVFSPDGRLALSGSDDQTLILWDVATGTPIRSFVGHTGEVTAVAFSPDGLNAVSGSQDTSVRLWEIATGAPLRTLIGHGLTVTGVAFSPHGRTVLSSSIDRDLRLWDLDNGAEVRSFHDHKYGVERVVFSHDGRYILSASDDHTLILWDAISGAKIRELKGHTSKVYGAAFSPDDSKALSASGDDTLILWDVASGRELRRFRGHTDWVLSVAFSPDGRTALSGSTDKTLILWDVASGRELRRFKGHTGSVQGVAFSPDGRTALSGSTDQTLILWDVASGRELRRFEGHTAPVRDVAFSPDGRTALSGSTDKTLILWDVAGGSRLRRFVGHNGAVLSVAFSPDGRTAASGSSDTGVILWDVATGRPLRRFAGHSAPVRDAGFSPDGSAILSGSLDKSLRLWRIDSAEALAAWTKANRDIPPLLCDQLLIYQLASECPGPAAKN